FEDRAISAPPPLPGRPPEARCPTAANHLLDIRISSRLVQFVVEGRHHVLPGGREDRDAVGRPAAGLRVYTDGVVHGRAVDRDRPMIAAQAVEGMCLLCVRHAPPPALSLGAPVARARCRIVMEDRPLWQHEVKHGSAEIETAELGLGEERPDQLLPRPLRHRVRGRPGQLLRGLERVTVQVVKTRITPQGGASDRFRGSVSKVEMTTPMALICKVLFPSTISTFETPPPEGT